MLFIGLRKFPFPSLFFVLSCFIMKICWSSFPSAHSVCLSPFYRFFTYFFPLSSLRVGNRVGNRLRNQLYLASPKDSLVSLTIVKPRQEYVVPTLRHLLMNHCRIHVLPQRETYYLLAEEPNSISVSNLLFWHGENWCCSLLQGRRGWKMETKTNKTKHGKGRGWKVGETAWAKTWKCKWS